MTFAQPGEHLWVTAAECVEVIPEGGQDDHVGAVQAAINRDDHVAEAAHRQAVGADQVNLEGRGQAQAELLAVAQAGHVEEVLGLQQGGGKYAFGGQNADALQGRYGCKGHGVFLF